MDIQMRTRTDEQKRHDIQLIKDAVLDMQKLTINKGRIGDPAERVFNLGVQGIMAALERLDPDF